MVASDYLRSRCETIPQREKDAHTGATHLASTTYPQLPREGTNRKQRTHEDETYA